MSEYTTVGSVRHDAQMTSPSVRTVVSVRECKLLEHRKVSELHTIPFPTAQPIIKALRALEACSFGALKPS